MSRGLRLAALAAALYLAGVLVWVRYDRRSAQEAFSSGSVFNTGDEGLSLAFAYLRERSGAGTLHRRIAPADLPANGVVLRVQPLVGPILLEDEEEEEKKDEKDPKDEKDGKDGEEGPMDKLERRMREEEERREKEEKERRKKAGEKEKVELPASRLLTPDEEAWVRGGGRLVLAFDGFYGSGRTEELQGRQPVRKVFPLWPGVAHLVPPTVRSLDLPALPGGHAVFLAGESPLVARQALGAGDVIFLAAPEIFHNPHLGQAHHLALLEALIGGRPVLFDERAHGLDDSGGILEILADWGLGPLLLLGLIATGAAFWRSARRLGPPEREERDTRSDAVELLDSLADLYDRALQRGDAVFLFYESFMHTVAVETGLRGKALEERSKALLEGYVPTRPIPGEELSRERFDEALRKINQAFRRLQDAKRK